MATFDTIRFRYPLKVFQKFQLKTRVERWNESTFYIRQTFERKGRVVARGYICASFLGPNGPVSPLEMLEKTGQPISKPNQPEIVARMIELEHLIHETQKEKIY